MIIDTKLKKAVTVPEEKRARLLEGAEPMDVPPPVQLPQVRKDEPNTISSTFAARYSDMDSNRYVQIYKYITCDIIAGTSIRPSM